MIVKFKIPTQNPDSKSRLTQNPRLSNPHLSWNPNSKSRLSNPHPSKIPTQNPDYHKSLTQKSRLSQHSNSQNLHFHKTTSQYPRLSIPTLFKSQLPNFSKETSVNMIWKEISPGLHWFKSFFSACCNWSVYASHALVKLDMVNTQWIATGIHWWDLIENLLLFQFSLLLIRSKSFEGHSLKKYRKFLAIQKSRHFNTIRKSKHEGLGFIWVGILGSKFGIKGEEIEKIQFRESGFWVGLACENLLMKLVFIYLYQLHIFLHVLYDMFKEIQFTLKRLSMTR